MPIERVHNSGNEKSFKLAVKATTAAETITTAGTQGNHR
jgi:hypothetical protein